MGTNFAQNWPIFLLLGAFIIFVITAIRNSREQERKEKEGQNK